MSLSTLIVQREIATIRQVEEALARQVLYGGDLVTNLLEVAKLDEATLTLLLAESFGLGAATLGPLPAPTEQAKGLITADMAAARAMVPLSIENGSLVVAVAEPLPKEAEEELHFALGFPVVQRIAPMVRVREALARAYGTPIERRLQRLLTRLGAAPTEAAAVVPVAPLASLPPVAPVAPSVPPSPSPPPAPPPPPAPAESPAPPPSGRAPFRPSATPPSPPAPPPSMRPRLETQLGLAPYTEPVPPPTEPVAVSIPSVHLAVTAPAPPPVVTSPPAAPAATLVQRGSQPPPRARRRRRGPFLAEQAARELEEAMTRDHILDTFFDFSRQYFDYTALFVVQADIAEGRDAFGDGARRERVVAIGVPLDIPSVLAAARDASTALRVTPAGDGIDEVLLGDLERTTRQEVLVAPIIVRKRAVALLYGDNGDEGVDAAAVKDVVAFSLLVGQAFEKLILRRKVQGAFSQTPAPVTRISVMPPPVAMTPAVPPVGLTPAAPAVAPGTPGVPGTPGAPGAPLTHRATLSGFEAAVVTAAEWKGPAPDASANGAVDALLDQTPTPASASVEPTPTAPSRPSDPPPPATAARASRPVGLPIPREDPAEAQGTPLSESHAVAARRPPLPVKKDDHSPLPSVIVDVDEEFGRLVDRVIANGDDETAEAELLRQGQKAMPAIMSRFPGPTIVDRARVEDGTLRVVDCGPVLRLIARQRRAALPFVLPLVGDGEPLRRYWATFLLTELAYAEAVDAVVPRLFDPDASVRRIAKLSARAVGEVAPEALMDRLLRQYRDPSVSEERRIEMIDTLGELRERLAVPLLVDALGDSEEAVAAAARKALILVARQDLGRDTRKWQAWWAANGSRHRIEWLVDALMHEVPAIRRAAGDELKAVTKEYFGYYDDLPRKERELAQQRYREWWRTDGRARFTRR
jgi:HEAT repeat protein